MWNVYVMIKGKCENPAVYASNLTAESIENIRIFSKKITGGFTRYSNWIWVDSSYASKLTGHFLKKNMTYNGRVVDYYVEPLLDTEEGLQNFVYKYLKQLACKNNIIIVSEEICERLVEILNDGKPVEKREYYHFKQDLFNKDFTLCN